MKTLLTFAVALLLFACNKSDDPKPIDPIVGVWVRDHYKIDTMPVNFKSYEGQELTSLGELSYIITLSSDATYKQRVEFPDGVFNDEGTYKNEDSLLSLKSTYNSNDEFTVKEIAGSNLTLLHIYRFNLLPDAIVDIMNENTLEDSVAQFRQVVDVPVIHYFVRQ